MRTTYTYHITWFVDSVTHRWGYRNFDTSDLSTNNWWVAMLTFGEGWHNNHHAQLRSAAHGMRRWEIDIQPKRPRGAVTIPQTESPPGRTS